MILSYASSVFYLFTVMGQYCSTTHILQADLIVQLLIWTGKSNSVSFGASYVLPCGLIQLGLMHWYDFYRPDVR